MNFNEERFDEEYEKTLLKTLKTLEKFAESETLSCTQQEYLRSLMQERTAAVMGGKDSPAYNGKLKVEVIKDFFWKLQEHCEVKRMADLKKHDYDKAKEFIEKYSPNEDLKEKIVEENMHDLIALMVKTVMDIYG